MAPSQSNPTTMFWTKSLQKDSVIGGFDRAVFKKLYVARVKTAGGYLAGYLRDGSSEAEVAGPDGKVVKSAEFETLVNPEDVFLEWIVPDGDRIPTGSVVAAEAEGKKIFMARAKNNGDYIPGTMVPTDAEDFAYIPNGDAVFTFKPGTYEVMCVNTVTPVLK